MRTRLDAIVSAFAIATGRSEDEVMLMMKTTLIPKMKNPKGLYESISEAEYQQARQLGETDKVAILKWMAEGARGAPFPFPNN